MIRKTQCWHTGYELFLTKYYKDIYIIAEELNTLLNVLHRPLLNSYFHDRFYCFTLK